MLVLSILHMTISRGLFARHETTKRALSTVLDRARRLNTQYIEDEALVGRQDDVASRAPSVGPVSECNSCSICTQTSFEGERSSCDRDALQMLSRKSCTRRSRMNWKYLPVDPHKHALSNVDAFACNALELQSTSSELCCKICRAKMTQVKTDFQLLSSSSVGLLVTERLTGKRISVGFLR